VTDCSCNAFPASLGPVYIEAGLGVGISTPQALAQLHGTLGLLILDDANQSGATGYWRLAVENGSLELDQNTSPNRDFSTFRGVLRTDGSGNLELGGSTGYGSAAPSLFVASNAGNVGVGTVTPQARLDVVGLLRVAGGIVVVPLGTPAAPTVTPTPSGGSTTWGYVITAVSEDGTETVGSPGGQTTTGPATLSGTSYNTVSTPAVPGAVAYNVYRTTAGGSPSSTGFLAQVTGPYQDTGAAAQSGRLPPTSDQTSWVGVGTSTPAGRLDLVGGGYLAVDNGDFGALRGLRFRNVLVRVDYSPSLSVPPDDTSRTDYMLFLAQVCQDARYNQNAWGYIIGNEPNWTADNTPSPINPAWYARVYNGYNAPVGDTGNAYQFIKTYQPNALVLVAPVAPWFPYSNSSDTYTLNEPWLNYFNEMCRNVYSGAEAKSESVDGFAIHTYGRTGTDGTANGGASEPHTDVQVPGGPSGAWFGFTTYKNWRDIIDQFNTTVPMWITETNTRTDAPSSNSYPSGWYLQALSEIASNGARFRSLCWFPDENYPNSQGIWSQDCLTNPTGKCAQANSDFDYGLTNTSY